MKDIRYYLVHALPEQPRRALVRGWCRRHCGTGPLEYPLDLEHVRAMLVVLPEDVLDALYQVDNVLSIKEHFSQASVTFLCSSSVAEYYHSIAADASFVEYNAGERYLFSKVMAYHAATLARERFQVCFLLETRPDLSLLNLVGLSAARVRVGYEHAAEYPFLNHLVRPSESRPFLADRYGAMARSLGAGPARRSTLAVGREASEGVAHLLRDIQLEPSATLVCLDCCGMADACGRDWTAHLLSALREGLPATVCCPTQHGCSEDTTKWLHEQGVAVVPPLTVPRLAALLSRSALVVSGLGPMLRLATLLGRPAVGVMAEQSRDMHLPPGGRVLGVTYEQKPGERTAAAVVARAQQLIARPVP